MNLRPKAYTLLRQSKEYHLKDPRWQRNFRARVNRIAKYYDPKDPRADTAVVMAIDHITARTKHSPTWKRVKS